MPPDTSKRFKLSGLQRHHQLPSHGPASDCKLASSVDESLTCDLDELPGQFVAYSQAGGDGLCLNSNANMRA
ncbi:unnamed protein product [Mesocestoides corti]|uniref:Uncharacterized protein n=1 Tax=Mesocestoides corti TaxID=53468 RepID=A0A0R3U832_MESCO|nr:unnamed protein product [Mesocestoides corti]